MILIVGCGSPKPSSFVDSNLPVINNIKTISSTRSIGLEWTTVRSSDIEGFYIYRSELNEPMELIYTIKDRFSTHFADKDLKPETTYRYTIKTYSKSAISSDGVVVSAKTAKAIETVSFAKAIYGLPERVKIIWRPHANLKVGSYIIERKSPEATRWSRIAEIKGRLNAEYIDNGVKSGREYNYRILVKTLDGEISAPSSVLSATTKELPDGVVDLRATTNRPKKIILTWDSPLNENFSHYQIYSSIGSFLPFLPLAKVDTNIYEDLINSNGTKRYYKVTFVDKDGLESKAQDEPVLGQTLGEPDAPVLSKPIINNKTIVLNWSAVSSASKYSIYRSSRFEKKNITDIVGTKYIDRDVQKGNKYTYEIYSVDEYGLSSKASNKISVEY
ncbi:hypothetical protein CRN67_06935 [Campylobacter blaseri]|uniref:Fibronectin type-III domain-containing protein n=2 Tax=Campylobacter blaseri TaxID=2042961 RepID=A0A2P8R051_9BACT|nr:hypothetical protein CQ405_06930 [Campylobacter blaseri]PSM53661.1 hypothetical protein CRN67_06935 [Campylobacter blaseri]